MKISGNFKRICPTTKSKLIDQNYTLVVKLFKKSYEDPVEVAEVPFNVYNIDKYDTTDPQKPPNWKATVSETLVINLHDSKNSDTGNQLPVGSTGGMINTKF